MQLLWQINLTLSHFNKKKPRGWVRRVGASSGHHLGEGGVLRHLCQPGLQIILLLFYFSTPFQNEEIVVRKMKCALRPPFSTWPTWPALKQSRRTPTCGTQMKLKTTSGTLRLRTRTISTLAIQTRNPQAPQQIIRLSEFCRSSFSLPWNKVRLGIFFSDNSKQVFQNAFSRYKPVSIYSLHHDHEQRNGEPFQGQT